MIKLTDIKRNELQAPRIVIYGVPGIGKTTLAACASAPVFIQTEDGLGSIDAMAYPIANSYADVLGAISSLIYEPNDYQTVVLDSLNSLEPMLWAQVCQDHGKRDIDEFGYQRGYKLAAGEWRKLLQGLDQLRSQGKMVILLDHAAVVRFESPVVDAYDRFQLSLHKWSEAVILGWADAVLFANQVSAAITSGERKRGVGDGSRVLLTTERPAWRAKNRYALPDQIPIPTGDPRAAWDAVMHHIANAATIANLSATTHSPS